MIESIHFIPFVHFSNIPEIPSEPSVESPKATFNGDATQYVSCYPYESGEIGDLTFGAGEYILVTKKDGDWWTGTIGNRTGIFPSNYVQEIPADDSNKTHTGDAYNGAISPTTNTQNYSDDLKNQEEADTEVSEINTQPKTESVQETYSRPMSSSSTTSVRLDLKIACAFSKSFLHNATSLFSGFSWI